MEKDIEKIEGLCRKAFGKKPDLVSKLPGAGSSRRYYRISVNGGPTLIATVGTCREENIAFIELARHFASIGADVPEVVAVDDDMMAYLQTDLGDVSLFDRLAVCRENGWDDREDEKTLLQLTVKALPEMQFVKVGELDFSKCYPLPGMDTRSVMWDLNYFKYCFLKAALPEFSEPRLENDFGMLAASVLSDDIPTGFMYRDFQSRNVIVHDDQPWFIDFQGGRRGPCLYDIVSFLWQARAAYPAAIRENLLNVYFRALASHCDIDEGVLRRRLPDFILFRSLQVLGAYGFRGYFERKSHFLKSIGPALANIEELLVENDFDHLPYLRDVLQAVIYRHKKAHEVTPRTTLRLTVTSFSYRIGYPEDRSGNGGGFVFDCRGVTNPGKYDQYKPLTGLDQPVIDFLEAGGEIDKFLENAYAVVKPSVEKYLKRGFTDLSVAFGCTGGRHRSVYSAQHFGEMINQRLGVEVEIVHRERGIKSFLPAR